MDHPMSLCFHVHTANSRVHLRSLPVLRKFCILFQPDIHSQRHNQRLSYIQQCRCSQTLYALRPRWHSTYRGRSCGTLMSRLPLNSLWWHHSCRDCTTHPQQILRQKNRYRCTRCSHRHCMYDSLQRTTQLHTDLRVLHYITSMNCLVLMVH